jgi:YgiT-type zinc finger domain-containing protein
MTEMKANDAIERKAYPTRCDLCGGDVVEEIVTLTYPDKEGRVRVIEGAPAGVCQQCHERYLSFDTAAAIDELLASPPTKRETYSVWEFAKAG